MHEASNAVNVPRILRFKIFVGVFVFASCVGLAALASRKHEVTALSDSINFDQTQCSWQGLDGQVYLRGHVDGPYRGRKFPKTDQGIASAQKACEGTSSCSGLTCKGNTCELRKGAAYPSPYRNEMSTLCKRTGTSIQDPGPEDGTNGSPVTCPGGWYETDWSFYLKDFASGPNGNGKPFTYDSKGEKAAKEACLLEPTCSGITCHVKCTLRSGDLRKSRSMERSYTCQGKR